MYEIHMRTQASLFPKGNILDPKKVQLGLPPKTGGSGRSGRTLGAMRVPTRKCLDRLPKRGYMFRFAHTCFCVFYTFVQSVSGPMHRGHSDDLNPGQQVARGRWRGQNGVTPQKGQKQEFVMLGAAKTSKVSVFVRSNPGGLRVGVI
jgi:hypothetical protein